MKRMKRQQHMKSIIRHRWSPELKGLALRVWAICLFPAMVSCVPASDIPAVEEVDAGYPPVNVVGEMRNVMWKGELGPSLELDTISERGGLYGLGPLTELKGELLIVDGTSYVSTVLADSTPSVEKSYRVSAPFFVYANVQEWNDEELPTHVKSISDLEKHIDRKTKDFERPFVFKLTGTVSNAVYHIQNLPDGAKVSSPEEAHQGQVKYPLKNVEAIIVGFFSTEHQGVFTHHDTFLHMHIITGDEKHMGHLDELQIDRMNLHLPVK